jgi:hypothetical protein
MFLFMTASVVGSWIGDFGAHADGGVSVDLSTFAMSETRLKQASTANWTVSPLHLLVPQRFLSQYIDFVSVAAKEALPPSTGKRLL